LFRKWRLKLSLKLLNKAYKNAAGSGGGNSGGGSNNSSNSTSPLISKSKNNNRELNSYGLMSSYGARLLSNLSVFHRLENIMVPKPSDSLGRYKVLAQLKY